MLGRENIPASAMSLRDHFAAKAMAALITRGSSSLDDISSLAYVVADAMLDARTLKPTSWPRLHTNTDFAKDIP